MEKWVIADAIRDLHERRLPDGGFSEHLHSLYRPDSTAWAIVALEAAGKVPRNVLDDARNRLMASQLGDGRVVLSKENPQTFWPTSLAILAWHNSLVHRRALIQSVNFLLNSAGLTERKSASSPDPMDISIPAWSWIERTFPWVEPTGLAILALKTTDYGAHRRVTQGRDMLLDRQLPRGGWNYGNTVVYGQELYPEPAATGIALAALYETIDSTYVQKSLDYLKGQIRTVRTPLSLAWSLIGLSAWNGKPQETSRLIGESLNRQRVYGSYGTTLLSLLVISFFLSGDLVSFIRQGNARSG
jgi:hypothetical protein